MPYPILYIKNMQIMIKQYHVPSTFEAKYARMDQVKFVEDSLKNQTLSRPYPFKFFKGSPTNFTWSILEYFVPFSQLLPIYQICVAKRNSSLRKVVFFYSVRLKFFLSIKGHSYQVTVFILFVFWLSYFARLHKKSSVFHECQLWCFARFGAICTI